nr:MAG TPA: hypothetical protein [Caudoviricetes sp.]
MPFRDLLSPLLCLAILTHSHFAVKSILWHKTRLNCRKNC